ncbi:hypothetical protein DY926_06075 [Komagataeibacter melaceti]|uniref:Uncharacterized protein n=1 Tax=Komagataeibacter melaceti TaxID=2766577 RepID=A0A371Z1S0_9PROT|nr:hypothetical protein [Komagataeibacter melaceti]RFD20422.1 hypothetical protein DY926_06075 [Komagataeibacter melaceti]
MQGFWPCLWVLAAMAGGHFLLGVSLTPWHVIGLGLAGVAGFLAAWGLFLAGVMLLAFISGLLERTGSKMRW